MRKKCIRAHKVIGTELELNVLIYFYAQIKNALNFIIGG